MLSLPGGKHANPRQINNFSPFVYLYFFFSRRAGGKRGCRSNECASESSTWAARCCCYYRFVFPAATRVVATVLLFIAPVFYHPQCR